MDNRSEPLSKFTSWIAELEQFSQGNPDRVRLRAWMDELFDVYCAFERAPGATGEAEVGRQIEQSLPRMERVAGSIALLYVPDIEDFLRTDWFGDEWVSACRARSAIEALRALYADRMESALAVIETDDLDELMRNRGEQDGHLPPASIPKGVPAAHWWWWYPEKPPGGS